MKLAKMTRRGHHRKNCLLAFLERSLSDPALSHLIRWFDQPSGVFQVLWVHAGRSNYHKQAHGSLFDLYREYRGHGMISDPKQAFRMALKKSPCVSTSERLENLDDWRTFRIVRKCHPTQIQDTSPPHPHRFSEAHFSSLKEEEKKKEEISVEAEEGDDTTDFFHERRNLIPRADSFIQDYRGGFRDTSNALNMSKPITESSNHHRASYGSANFQMKSHSEYRNSTPNLNSLAKPNPCENPSHFGYESSSIKFPFCKIQCSKNNFSVNKQRVTKFHSSDYSTSNALLPLTSNEHTQSPNLLSDNSSFYPSPATKQISNEEQSPYYSYNFQASKSHYNAPSDNINNFFSSSQTNNEDINTRKLTNFTPIESALGNKIEKNPNNNFNYPFNYYLQPMNKNNSYLGNFSPGFKTESPNSYPFNPNQRPMETVDPSYSFSQHTFSGSRCSEENDPSVQASLNTFDGSQRPIVQLNNNEKLSDTSQFNFLTDTMLNSFYS